MRKGLLVCYALLITLLLVSPAQARIPYGDFEYSNLLKKGHVYMWDVTYSEYDSADVLINQVKEVWRLELFDDFSNYDPDEFVNFDSFLNYNFTTPDKIGELFSFDVKTGFFPLIAPANFDNIYFFEYLEDVSPVDNVYIVSDRVSSYTYRQEAIIDENRQTNALEEKSRFHKETGMLVDYTYKYGRGLPVELPDMPINFEIHIIQGPQRLMDDIFNTNALRNRIIMFSLIGFGIIMWLLVIVRKVFSNPLKVDPRTLQIKKEIFLKIQSTSRSVISEASQGQD